MCCHKRPSNGSRILLQPLQHFSLIILITVQHLQLERKRPSSNGSIWQAVCHLNGREFQVFLHPWPCLNSSPSAQYSKRPLSKKHSGMNYQAWPSGLIAISLIKMLRKHFFPGFLWLLAFCSVLGFFFPFFLPSIGYQFPSSRVILVSE